MYVYLPLSYRKASAEDVYTHTQTFQACRKKYHDVAAQPLEPFAQKEDKTCSDLLVLFSGLCSGILLARLVSHMQVSPVCPSAPPRGTMAELRAL